VPWFFRVIEQADGSWACRRGREELDRHAELDEAVSHASSLAAAHAPAEVMVHFFDGTMRYLPAAHDE
jgi:hypothetical protein